jgi:hypothetical protein
MEQAMYEQEMKKDLKTLRDLNPELQRTGNLGTFRIYDPQSGNSYGKKVFGASYQLYQNMRDAIRTAGEVDYQIITNAVTATDFMSGPSGKEGVEVPLGYVIYRHVIKEFEGEDAYIVPETYPATPTQNNKRNYDSEYFILNHAQEVINQLDPAAAVIIELLTELPPCSSCTVIIIDFLNNNPNATISVFHTKKNSPAAGIAHPRASLTKV